MESKLFSSRLWCVPLLSLVAVIAQAEELVWAVELEQARLSAVINGDLLDDERSLTASGTESARTWARNSLHLRRTGEVVGRRGSEWSAFMVQEVHIRGRGVQAGVRLNQDSGLEGTAYSFNVNSVQHRRWGLSWHHQAAQVWTAPLVGPVQWHVGASAFVVDRFKSITAEGVLTDGAAGRLGLQARTREDELGGTSSFVQPDKPLGWGATLDAGVQGGEAGSLQWALEVRELGPKIRLRHVLGEDKTIDTDTVTFDAEGYTNFAPAIRGRYTDRAAKLRIEPEWRARFSQPLGGRGQIQSALVLHGARKEWSLGYAYPVTADQRITVTGFALRDMPASLGVRWDARHISLAWRGDRLKASKALIWVLEGGLRF